MIQRQRRVNRRPTELLDRYTDEEFRMRFRITKSTFEVLLVMIKDGLSFESLRNNPISPEVQLLITLRFFATGDFQMTNGDLFGVHQTSVCRIVHRVSPIFAKMSDMYIRFPDSEELSIIRRHFYDNFQFPGVIGAVDGTHIRIEKPTGPVSELYRNRKDYFSINTQVMCDHNLKIRDLVVRWYGSAHDSRVFNNSRLMDRLEGLTAGSWVLGDSGYPCLPFTLTPFLRPNSHGQQAYNTAHCKARNVVERCIGVWKRRFPVIKYCLRVDLSRCPAIIIATAVLNNIAIDEGDPDFGEEDSENSANDEVVQPITGSRGNVIRNAVVAQYFP